jgi:hypothetical protein
MAENNPKRILMELVASLGNGIVILTIAVFTLIVKVACLISKATTWVWIGSRPRMTEFKIVGEAVLMSAALVVLVPPNVMTWFGGNHETHRWMQAVGYSVVVVASIIQRWTCEDGESIQHASDNAACAPAQGCDDRSPQDADALPAISDSTVTVKENDVSSEMSKDPVSSERAVRPSSSGDQIENTSPTTGDGT